MLDRKERLNEVYEHLHNHFGVHKKQDFADIIGYARAYISSALNGNERYLTDKLFISICEKYKGVFNLEYLLTGEGELLTPEEDAKSSEIENATNQQFSESAAFSNLMEIFSRTIRESDDLRVQLKNELEEIKKLKSELSQARDNFRDATFRLREAISIIYENNHSSIGIAAEQKSNNYGK